MTRSLRNAPWVLAVVLPTVAFLVIGRTVEIAKAGQLLPIEGGEDESVASTLVNQRLQHRSGMGDNPSAMAGLGGFCAASVRLTKLSDSGPLLQPTYQHSSDTCFIGPHQAGVFPPCMSHHIGNSSDLIPSLVTCPILFALEE